MGDIYCIIGACLYAVSNVSQEYIVKKHSNTEFLGCIGLAGTFLGLLQLLFVCSSEIMVLQRIDVIDGVLILTFVALLFTMYSATSIFLQGADSVVFNMSLLTSDIFGAIIGYFLFATGLSVLYLVSLCLIIAGVLLYGEGPSVSPESNFGTATPYMPVSAADASQDLLRA